MKLQAEIGDDKFDLEISRTDRDIYARVGEREYRLDVSEPQPGVLLCKNDGKIFEVSLDPEAASGSRRASIGEHSFEIKIIDPKRLRGSGGDSSGASGKVEIKTAMPGKIVRVLKTDGDAVEKGEGVIVVEAMKMQNEMKSPKDGSIIEIKFAEGETVGAGDVLAVIE